MNRVIALVPSHNEQQCIGGCIAALQAQIRPPDTIVIIADNCRDGTAGIAHARGAEVYETVGNTGKKAGALNQVLRSLIHELDQDDYVLVLDADSYLDPTFVSEALRFHSKGRYGGVGGNFRGRSGGGYIGWLQRNEFARYQRDTGRLKGKTLCLTGTAVIFKVRALRDVARSRESFDIYSMANLTEDFEISVRLESLGWKIIAPKGCTLSTEVMETWGDLARQRLRWKRGAVETLIQYGLNSITLKHWTRQILSIIGILVTIIYLGSIALFLGMYGSLTLMPLWIAVTLIFMVERVVTVHRRGVRHALASSILITEIPYDIYLQYQHCRAYVQAFLNTERSW